MFFRMVYKSGQIFVPFCHNPRVWQTDRQTDRIFIASPRLNSMQRGKNRAEKFNLRYFTRCSAIAERPRCRVRYSFRQK